MNDALAATDEATAKTLWEKAQDLLRGRHARPCRSSTRRRRRPRRRTSRASSAAATCNEFLNTVWLDK